MSFVVKTHRHTDGRIFLTVCDSDIVGRKFSEGSFQLDLTSAYFSGDEKGEEEVLYMLPKAHSIIFVGKNSVGMGVKHNYVEKDNVSVIESVPTAQCMVFL